jgi:hypothetical protein
MSPTLQRLILHLLQPMVYGGLFLLGFIMRRYPLSFIGLAVVVLVITGLIVRALRKDRLEKEENELILETLQEERRRQQEEEEEKRKKEKREERQDQQDQEFDSEIPPSLPSPSLLARETSHGSSGGRPSSNSFDGSDRESLSSRGRRYSSSAEDLRASYLLKAGVGGGRNRVNSVESTGSLPFRVRGSSMDSVGSENFVWRSPSYPTEYFNDLILDEREEKGSGSEVSDPYEIGMREREGSISVSEGSLSDGDDERGGEEEEDSDSASVEIVVKVQEQQRKI